MSYEYETLKVEVADHICTVMLHRPHRRNALNPQGYSDLEAVFRQIQEDPEVRVVVLTGCEGAFCAGEDVKEMMTGKPAPDSHARLRKPRPSMTPAAEAILACDRPIIAAVNGVAVGWGMDLSLLADMRVASTEARFASLFVKRGLITDLGGLWRLPKLVGPERAAELIFSGRMIDGAEAAALGMVLEVVPADELMIRARALAMSIAENPPLAVRYLKEGLRRSTWSDPEPMGSWISQTLGVLFATEDHREGVASFLEKRPPKFTGR